MSDLEDLLDAEVETWMPEPGDKLVGKIVQITTGSNQFHDCYPILKVIPKDGTAVVVVHAFATVFADELAKLNPQEGDTLLVKYLGKPEGKNYAAFTVYVERAPDRSGSLPSVSTRARGEPAERVVLVSDEQAGEITGLLKQIGEWKGIDTVKQEWKDRGFPSVGNLPAARYDEVMAWINDVSAEPF